MSQNIGQLVAELNALVSKMETQRGVCVTVADDLDSLHDMLNAAMEGTNSTAQNEAVGQLGAAAAKLLEAGGLISTACDVVSTYASTLQAFMGGAGARLRACRFLVRLGNCSGRSYWREKGREIQRKQLCSGGLC